MRTALEDLKLGQEFLCGTFVLTRAEIIAFAMQFDPQPWHLDEDLAQGTFFEGLCASGLHTQGAAIGLMVRAIADVDIMAGGALHEARFYVPVRPDQPYRVTAAWTKARASATNPARGVAAIDIVARDSAGTAVMECGVTYIVGRRHG